MRTAEECRMRIADLFAAAKAPEFPSSGEPFVIYGAGKCGATAAKTLLAKGYGPVAFLDARAESSPVDDLPLIRPGTRAAANLARGGLPVLVAVFNYETDISPILAALQADGFRKFLPMVSFAEMFPESLADGFWLAPRSEIERNRELIEAVADYWEDDASRGIYVEALELRLSGNPKSLALPDTGGQYFPADLAAVPSPLRFLDGGAFRGDTLARLPQTGCEAVAAFEPDEKNYRDLCAWFAETRPNWREAVFFPCGLGARNGFSGFSGERGSSSRMDGAGETKIPVIRLDDALPLFRPNFVKLDVEGAELDALEGAKATLGSSPRLAVCLYHAPSHFWEVPMAVKTLLPGSRLFLRYHGYNGFDTVVYALPS